MSFNVVEAAKHDRVQNAIDISQKILSNHKQRQYKNNSSQTQVTSTANETSVKHASAQTSLKATATKDTAVQTALAPRQETSANMRRPNCSSALLGSGNITQRTGRTANESSIEEPLELSVSDTSALYQAEVETKDGSTLINAPFSFNETFNTRYKMQNQK